MKKAYTVVLIHQAAADAQDNPVVGVLVDHRAQVEYAAQKEAAALWNGEGPEEYYAPEEFEVCAVFEGDLCCV